ncbi:MAG: hypothetical protein GXY64_07990 [Bacteroidales bacterium]|nr:hypothetical protein [Bacteroidales bacterium]
MKRILPILLTSILLISSCKYTVVHLFSDKELEWMDAYSDGDTILYTSDNVVDTMLVSESIYNKPDEFRALRCNHAF